MSTIEREFSRPLSWDQLTAASNYNVNNTDGPTNAQSYLRLFGRKEADVRITLFRDYAAWCPYCQKVWLWLEEKRIPYRIQKVTMFCYGEKESWYKKIVPSGMLPAVQLDGRIVTESDEILLALEEQFGPLGGGYLCDPHVMELRQLERYLFRAWCQWLCYPSRSAEHEGENQRRFEAVVRQVCGALEATPGPYFLSDFSCVDVIFVPYLERMNASLYAYKGFHLRKGYPAVEAWFAALETRSCYLGTQSDFHTHVHDLPPQMGACCPNGTMEQQRCMERVNRGPWFGLPDTTAVPPEGACEEAVRRVAKHRANILKTNIDADKERMDVALRCVLTTLLRLPSTVLMNEECLMATSADTDGGESILIPPTGSALGLRYLRDHICVPRDMSIYAAKYLKTCLQLVSSMDPDGSSDSCEPGALPVKHRRDQDPRNFHTPTTVVDR
jgi:glutathione S-transferase